MVGNWFIFIEKEEEFRRDSIDLSGVIEFEGIALGGKRIKLYANIELEILLKLLITKLVIHSLKQYYTVAEISV